MVEITYREIRNGFELKAEGHCRYAEKGKDIACAGVSTLIVALAKGCCRNVSREEVHGLIDEIYDEYGID